MPDLNEDNYVDSRYVSAMKDERLQLELPMTYQRQAMPDFSSITRRIECEIRRSRE
jgi:hypothetical protein